MKKFVKFEFSIYGDCFVICTLEILVLTYLLTTHLLTYLLVRQMGSCEIS